MATVGIHKRRSRKKRGAGDRGHFPKKGERKVNGEWVPAPEPEAAAPEAPKRTRTVTTASDRRNWLRERAGWPKLRSK